MKETDIQHDVQLAASRAGARLFRNNVGLFRSWVGDRKVRCGLCPGSADLIGWRSVKITADMVGKTIAQFVSCEVKKPKKNEEKPQENWRATVTIAGGCAFVARSVKDLLTALRGDL